MKAKEMIKLLEQGLKENGGGNFEIFLEVEMSGGSIITNNFTCSFDEGGDLYLSKSK